MVVTRLGNLSASVQRLVEVGYKEESELAAILLHKTKGKTATVLGQPFLPENVRMTNAKVRKNYCFLL